MFAIEAKIHVFFEHFCVEQQSDEQILNPTYTFFHFLLIVNYWFTMILFYLTKVRFDW